MFYSGKFRKYIKIMNFQLYIISLPRNNHGCIEMGVGFYILYPNLKHVENMVFSLNNPCFWTGRPRGSGRLSWWWWGWWRGWRQGRHATIVKESKVWVIIMATAYNQYLLKKLVLLPLSPTKFTTKQWSLVNDWQISLAHLTSAHQVPIQRSRRRGYYTLGERRKPWALQLGPHIALFSGKEMET